jgi:hypothetical protein
MASSQLYANEIIIGDEQEYETPEGFSRGLELGLRGSVDGFAYDGLAEPFNPKLLIPRSDWQALIKEREERGLQLSQIMRRNKLPMKNQRSTNYCWIISPVHTLEIRRILQNEGYLSLSPASAGAIIKQFRNVGGWGKEALAFLAKYGCVPSKMWPDTAIDRRYATAAARQEALLHRCFRWTETRPRNLDQMVSMLLRGIPGAFGYNWWGHEITGVDIIWLDGEVALRIRNQWEGWGDDGYGILRASRMLPDDAVYPLSVNPLNDLVA